MKVEFTTRIGKKVMFMTKGSKMSAPKMKAKPKAPRRSQRIKKMKPKNKGGCLKGRKNK